MQSLTPGHKAQLEAQEAGAADHQNVVPSPDSFFSRLARARTPDDEGRQRLLTDMQVASQGGPFVIAGEHNRALLRVLYFMRKPALQNR